MKELYSKVAMKYNFTEKKPMANETLEFHEQMHTA